MAVRYSQADEPQLVTDPDEIARVESENALRQFDAAMEEYDAWMKSSKYRLRLSLILRLHRVLMETLSEYAGIPRPATVTIEGSRHKPPRADEVPRSPGRAVRLHQRALERSFGRAPGGFRFVANELDPPFLRREWEDRPYRIVPRVVCSLTQSFAW
jgi:hypothetical protein